MPWVKFTRDFFWKPVRVQTMLYKEGSVALVTTPCADKARSSGAAILVDRPANAKRVSYVKNNRNQKRRKIDKKA